MFWCKPMKRTTCWFLLWLGKVRNQITTLVMPMHTSSTKDSKRIQTLRSHTTVYSSQEARGMWCMRGYVSTSVGKCMSVYKCTCTQLSIYHAHLYVYVYVEYLFTHVSIYPPCFHLLSTPPQMLHWGSAGYLVVKLYCMKFCVVTVQYDIVP